MIYRTDEQGQTWYMVTNNQGLCLIRTTNGGIAHYVNAFTKRINPKLRLNVGGDSGTKNNPQPRIFHHMRRYR
jgi:hypothetical protein